MGKPSLRQNQRLNLLTGLYTPPGFIRRQAHFPKWKADSGIAGKNGSERVGGR